LNFISGAMSVSPRPGRTPPPSPLHAPPLARWLAGLDGQAALPATTSFAERLSPWLAWTDAIALSAVLQPVPVGTAVPAAAAVAARKAVTEARQVHAELDQGIREGTASSHAQPSHAQNQRHMDDRIGAARARLRRAMAVCSPRLRQLAALDEVLDQALGARERQLLSTLPRLLHHAAPARKPATEPPESGPDDQALHTLLLAELHSRWQPVQGLIEALDTALTETLATAPAARR
jgi:hypothetical protein